ncbi:MAG: hypothetical protein KO202_06140 [Methanobacteriaceae archaeon]|jgi:hypothetical protein|nr:hypothetical protein [Methanobacteriaceae archaeon]
MPTYTKKGDAILGNTIIADARKVYTPRIVNKSGRHKTQRIVLKDNVKCVIDKEIRIISKK